MTFFYQVCYEISAHMSSTKHRKKFPKTSKQTLIQKMGMDMVITTNSTYK